jgi:hypothetical protein
LEEITIAPGETKSTFYQRINVSELVARHVKNKINVSHVQVGVIRVKFQSGKEWSFDLAAVGSFDDHQQTNSMECPADCADGQTTQTTALPKETLRAKAESNSPDTGHICLYRCIGTASYTYCVIVNNPAPGCTKDSLGHCCSAPTCTPELCPPYGTCYLQCDGS